MTYSLTRFAIYETARDRLSQGTQGPLPFYQKVLLGAAGGEQGPGSPGHGLWPGLRSPLTLNLLWLQVSLVGLWGPRQTW